MDKRTEAQRHVCLRSYSQHTKRFPSKPARFLSPGFDPNPSVLLFPRFYKCVNTPMMMLCSIMKYSKAHKVYRHFCRNSTDIQVCNNFPLFILIYLKDYYYSIFKIMRQRTITYTLYLVSEGSYHSENIPNWQIVQLFYLALMSRTLR